MKNQMKFQKIIVKTFVIFAAISVLYSLIFATPFFQLMLIEGNGFESPGIESFEAIYLGIQPFNHMYFYLCLAFLLSSLLLFVFFTQSRRLYYASNFIVTGINAVFGLVISIVSLINIFTFRAQFTAIDFDYVAQQFIDAGMDPNTISSSTLTFDIGIIIFVVVIALSGCLVANAIWKMCAMKKDKKEFAEIDAQIRQSWADHQQKLLEEAGLDEG